MDIVTAISDLAVFLFDAIIAYAGTEQGQAQIVAIIDAIEGKPAPTSARETTGTKTDPFVSDADIQARARQLAQSFRKKPSEE